MTEFLRPDPSRLAALSGKIVVIKYGGNAMTDAALQESFMRDLVHLHQWGVRPVLVHGGGPQIDRALAQIGHTSTFIEGQRKTDALTLQVVQWVLLGEVQPQLVGLIQLAGGRAVGLSGRDGQLFMAQKYQPVMDSKSNSKPDFKPDSNVDLGFVGEVVTVNPQVITSLLAAGYIPVVSSIAQDATGQAYNINADVACGQLARALSAHKLLLMTNIAGVLDGQKKLLSRLTGSEISHLIKTGVINGGMLPKIIAALAVANSGVAAVHIVDGREKHIALHALFGELRGEKAVGTEIVA